MSSSELSTICAPRTTRVSLRQRVRESFERGLERSGAGSWYAQRSGAIILMYHSVLDAELAPWIDPANAVPRSIFERQMQFLARHRRVVALSDLLTRLEEGETPEPGTVVLTFDDGYRDMLCNAAAVLAHLNLPVTLYLATGYVTRGESQWIDRLYGIFGHRTRETLRLDGEPFNLARADTRDAAYRAVTRRLLGALHAEREALLQAVEEELRPDRDPPRLTLTWEEVVELARMIPRLEVGAHTREHVDLTAHGPGIARAEIETSVQDVREALGQEVKHLSYPYGRWDASVRALAVDAGLRSAATTTPARRIGPAADWFALPRVPAPNDLVLFRFRTGAAYPDLPRRLWGRP